MGSSYGILKLSCKMLLICIIIAAPDVGAAITCPNVVNSLMPCMNYLLKGGVAPSWQSPCCTGVKKLNSTAKTKPDRQTVCNCLKDAIKNVSSRHPSFNLNRAKDIPKNCRVHINYEISPNADCSKVP